MRQPPAAARASRRARPAFLFLSLLPLAALGLLSLLLATAGSFPGRALAGEPPQKSDKGKKKKNKKKRILETPESRALADEILGGRYKRRFTKHYRVYADTGSALATEIGKAAELTHARFFAEFGRPFDLEPPADRMLVLVFEDREEYLNFFRGLGVQDAERSSGAYDSEHHAIFFTDRRDTMFGMSLNEVERAIGRPEMERLILEENQRTVMHEATHQLQDLTGLLSPVGPLWLAEGMAVYFGDSSEIRDGRLVFARQRTPDFGGVLKQSVARYRRLPVRLEEMAGIGSEMSLLGWRFPGNLAVESYGQSWAMYHYFMHGGGNSRARLRAYIGALQELEIPPPSPEMRTQLTATQGTPAYRQVVQRYLEEIGRTLGPVRVQLFREHLAEGNLPALEQALLQYIPRLPDPPVIEARAPNKGKKKKGG